MKLFFVTGNKHKLAEASEILKPYGISLKPPPPPVRKLELQSESLEHIALMAARHAYARLLAPLVVEDSGLFIEALRGFPGPYSNYTYRTAGIDGVLRMMRGIKRRDAYFKAAAACICPPYEAVFTGMVKGVIAEEARGTKGFGFDPIFIPCCM
jgi:XTP/dITP diphosphohydrolase